MNAPWHLLDSYFDGNLTSEEKQQLQDWLSIDAQHLRVFVEEAHLHYRLRKELLANRAFAGVADMRSEAAAAGTAPANDVEPGALRLVTFPKANVRRAAWKTSLALAAGFTLLAALLTWLFPRVHDEATLALRTGAEVTIERGTEMFPARDGVKLRPDDILLVGGGSLAAISYGQENTRLDLQPGTTVKLLDWTRGKRLELRLGRLEAAVARQRPFKPLLVRTPNAEARVIGTEFTLTAKINHTQLDVTEGRVRLTRTSDATAVTVGPGQRSVVAGQTKLSALPMTGGIVGEYWTNVPGVFVRSLEKDSRFPDHPDKVIPVQNFQAQSDWGDNYGARFRAYVHPPLTGEYTFWTAGSDEFFFFVSPDDNPKGSQCVCYGSNIQQRDWDLPQRNEKAMQSVPVHMEAGRKYYVEALLKAAVGEDHLAVAWRMPDGERKIISGEYLSPFTGKPKEKQR